MRWLLIEKLLRILASLLVSVFSITILGMSGLGTYSTYLLPLSLTLTLSSAVTRNALRATPLDVNLIYSYRHSFLCEIAISLFLSLLSSIYYYSLPGATANLTITLSLLTLSCSVLNCFELDELTYLRHGFDKRLSIVLLSQLSFSLLAKIFVLLAYRSPLSFFSVQLLDQLTSVLFLLSFCPKGSYVLRSFSDLPVRGLFPSTYRYGIAILSKSLVEVQFIIQSKADQFLLAFLLPAPAFGFYSLYLRFIDLGRSLHSTISSHFIARICRTSLATIRSSLTRRYLVASILLSLFTTILFLVAAFLPTAFHLTLFDLPLSSTLVFSSSLILLLNPLPLSGYSISLLRRTHIPSLYSMTIAILYLILLYLAAKAYGLTGALFSLAALYLFQVLPYLETFRCSLFSADQQDA